MRGSKIILSALALILPGIVYLSTSAPRVLFIDSGELAVVCCTLGIAHPAGYPAYTLVGKLFTLLPLGDVIFRLNLLSLVLICFTNLFLFLSLCLLAQKQFSVKNKNLVYSGSFVSALIFAYTPTLWSQATTNEVYPLAIFFCSFTIYLSLLWLQKGNFKLLCLLVFIYALSFGNHMSTIFLLPSLIFLILIKEKKNIFRSKKILSLLAFFILGITIYLYLPIRAAQKPLLNWGNPSNWENFIRHVSGWQYQVWMFSESFQQLKINLSSFFQLFYHQFPFYLIISAFLGIFLLIKRNKKVFYFFLILFLSNLFYGINYSIPDIEPYFLVSFFITSLWIGSGIFFTFQLTERIKEKSTRKITSGILLAAFFGFAILNLAGNYFEQDKSKNTFAYQYADNILRSVEKNAVILTNVWDHYSPWLYLRYVENLRPDVRFIDVRLSIRSWHFDYLKKKYPSIYALSQKEIEEFKEQVYLFENKKPYRPEVIERKYVDMVRSFIQKNYPTSPIYYDIVVNQETRNIDLWVSENMVKIPEGLVFRLKEDLDYYPYQFPELDTRGITDREIYKDDRTQTILRTYSFMIKNRITYLKHYGKDSEAEKLLQKYQKLLF
ncbi:MAG: hypothetical protein AMJ90_06105 [candidate division Zixibacteria bacterium SM23_73_2]|nr:MAG: hypothetical protein AMJ90_06105 [candidate division Zixibacteria bacterium SM23_73_2]